MPTYMVTDGQKGVAMRVSGNSVVWETDARKANTYPSKYAAKKHLRTLDNVPEDVKIIELISENGENLNG